MIFRRVVFVYGKGKNKKTGLEKDLSFYYITCSCLDGALNLTGTQASCTDIDMARNTLNNSLNALNIGLPGSVGTSVGMGDLDTKGNALTAKIALCHLLHLLAIK